MAYQDCVLYLSQGVLQIGSKALKVKLHKQSDNLCARIQVSESISIPPFQNMIICGQINDRHKSFVEELGTIETLESLPEAVGLHVARTLINTKQKPVPVRIANFGEDYISE